MMAATDVVTLQVTVNCFQAPCDFPASLPPGGVTARTVIAALALLCHFTSPPRNGLLYESSALGS
jgi:hypothetical protein